MKRHQSGAEKRKKIQEFVESQKNAFHKYLLVNSDIELPVPSTSSFEPCHRPIRVEKREEEGGSEHQVDEKNSEITEDRENPDKLYNKKNEEINDIALWPARRGHASYLSYHICDEFVGLVGNQHITNSMKSEMALDKNICNDCIPGRVFTIGKRQTRSAKHWKSLK
ncbi:hypothetical protein HELRODRAFT_182111 [Helobdella robusta]|uniref:Uncharacterized protein n=1 Tax=Helobdella robusta TaxID=6412 RepID=T1FHR9_HELRO|nr:hypothetical protein HELRODRAFT_182111 [Helobdella robusta]ESN91253.1 hypothetical protein HELRODRAFT_182111 [Helobdella robusta]